MDLPSYVSASRAGTHIDLFVQPRAARNALAGSHGAALKLKVNAPPVENRANKAVESFIADLLHIPPSRVTVVGGGASRHKRVEVAGLAPLVVADRLAAAS